MRILVVDDNPTHREAAKQQLGQEHDLTVVSSCPEVEDLCLNEVKFEVILTDLLLPAESRFAGLKAKEAYEGVEMPLGIFLALNVIVHGGVLFAGVLSDASHHDHPASALMDGLTVRPTRVGDALLLCDNRSVINCRPGDLTRPLTWTEVDAIEAEGGEVVRAKDWRKLLTRLTH